ncbi:MAG TPA: hypothetical protein VI564_03055 [Candidatus Nanoarchaeia archaeon]|nr:hypothetical protein [Candidatus Nanoarchaeia archaeon]
MDTNSGNKVIIHTKLIAVKLILILWVLDTLIGFNSKIVFFGLQMEGITSIIFQSIKLIVASALIYGAFNHEKWAWAGSLIVVGLVQVLSSIINLAVVYLSPNDPITKEGSLIGHILAIVVFSILSFEIYVNKNYFSGKDNVVYEKNPGKSSLIKTLLIDVLIAVILAVVLLFYILTRL